MGNSIYRFLCGLCSQASQELGLHGAHPAVAALGRDVLNFEATSQVTVVRVLRIGYDELCVTVSVLLIWGSVCENFSGF
jgi:hypothetical protein